MGKHREARESVAALDFVGNESAVPFYWRELMNFFLEKITEQFIRALEYKTNIATRFRTITL